MKTLKLSILTLLVIVCSSFTNYNNSYQGIETMTSNSSAKALVRGWSKVKRCLKGMGNCALAVTDEDYLNQENAIPVILELNGTSELVITNQISKTNDDGNQLVFDKDTSIPTSLANILGKESIIIISGSYPTSFDVNKNGQTVVKISVK